MSGKRKFINSKEAAEYVYLTESTVRTYVSQQKIPYFKIGSKVFFDPNILDEWLDSKFIDSKRS